MDLGDWSECGKIYSDLATGILLRAEYIHPGGHTSWSLEPIISSWVSAHLLAVKPARLLGFLSCARNQILRRLVPHFGLGSKSVSWVYITDLEDDLWKEIWCPVRDGDLCVGVVSASAPFP